MQKALRPIADRPPSVERSVPRLAVAAVAAAPPHDLIKLAIDVHGDLFVVARQVDSAVAQPPQQFKTDRQLLDFIGKQLALARRVVCCYEAGCFGFGLHRRIEALGARNLVVAPQNWDERNTGVRTDRTDAREMLGRLDRYLAGNLRALAVVRVPSEAAEVARSRVREREQFQRDRNRTANRGKSLLLQYGVKVSWGWWQPKHWEQTQRRVREELPPPHAETILAILGDHQELAFKLSEKLAELTAELTERQKQKQQHRKAKSTRRAGEASQQEQEQEQEQSATHPATHPVTHDDEPAAQEPACEPACEPAAPAVSGFSAVRLRGVGELSAAKIEAEVGDWGRFANRRQVSSYTGLCPGVVGTGGQFTQLSITKHGNPRLRAALVELAWLVVRYQGQYPPVLRWKATLDGRNRSTKKKAIVAIARRLAVDLWRLGTRRATPQQLGLKLAA